MDEDEDFVAGNYFRLLGRALPLNSPSEYYVTEGPQSRLSQDDPFLQGYYDKFFVEERKLGRGQRGSVFYVTHVLNGIPLGHFALKAIPVGRSQEWLVRMLQEVRLLEQLHHPNIVDYKHAWIEDRQLTVFGTAFHIPRNAEFSRVHSRI